MRLNRRNVLTSAAALGASLAIPAIAHAQQNRTMRGVDIDGNTATAKSLVDAVEPILSSDTAYNLQLAI